MQKRCLDESLKATWEYDPCLCVPKGWQGKSWLGSCALELRSLVSAICALSGQRTFSHCWTNGNGCNHFEKRLGDLHRMSHTSSLSVNESIQEKPKCVPRKDLCINGNSHFILSPNSRSKLSWASWPVSAVLIPGRQTQRDWVLEVSLGYIVRVYVFKKNLNIKQTNACLNWTRLTEPTLALT